MRSFLRILIPAAALLAVAVPATAIGAGKSSGGVTGSALYVDGVPYRTVLTPTDLTGTGAPDHSFDTIYAIVDTNGNMLQMSVATAGPGDPGYNGGRWRVTVATFADYAGAVLAYDTNGSGDLDSDEEVEAAIAGGAAMTSAGPSFVCPVIKMPKGHGG